MLTFLLTACISTPDTAAPSDTGEAITAGPMALETILDLDGTVTTKGMDVADDGRIFVWNYNQDDLEVWDGTELSAVATEGLITSFGTDLVVDDAGGVIVSKGGSSTGEVLQRWDATTGETLWGDEGLTISGGLMLGMTMAGGDLYAADGAAGLIRRCLEESRYVALRMLFAPMELG